MTDAREAARKAKAQMDGLRAAVAKMESGEGNPPSASEQENATYTAAEVKVLTETAGEAGRRIGWKAAGEEIAAALERCEDDARRAERTEGIAGNRGTAKTYFDLAAGYMRSAELAREVASQPSGATSDATSGVPGHQEVSEAVRSPQEPCGHPTCPCAVCPDCGLTDDHKGGCPQTGEAPQPGAPG